jgi:hypothetical protein
VRLPAVVLLLAVAVAGCGEDADDAGPGDAAAGPTKPHEDIPDVLPIELSDCDFMAVLLPADRAAAAALVPAAFEVAAGPLPDVGPLAYQARWMAVECDGGLGDQASFHRLSVPVTPVDPALDAPGVDVYTYVIESGAPASTFRQLLEERGATTTPAIVDLEIASATPNFETSSIYGTHRVTSTGSLPPLAPADVTVREYQEAKEGYAYFQATWGADSHENSQTCTVEVAPGSPAAQVVDATCTSAESYTATILGSAEIGLVRT